MTGRVTLPGDAVPMLAELEGGVRLGNGLRVSMAAEGMAAHRMDGDRVEIVPTKAGTINKVGSAKGDGERFFVQNQQWRYIPTVEDSILGVVIDRHGESYKLNIGSAAPATLSAIAFEGASRRNRPHLEVRPVTLQNQQQNVTGCTILLILQTCKPATCKILRSDGCVFDQIGALVHAKVVRADKFTEPELSCTGGSKGWATGESIFGPLEGGYIIECSLSLASKSVAIPSE